MKRDSKVRQCFPREAHLRRPEEFKAVKDAGVCARFGEMAFGFLRGSRRRLGIAASKAVGSAVERNRVKRVIREFFRQNRDLFPVGDCVVIPGRSSGKLSNDEIRRRLAGALEKISGAGRGV